MGWPAAFAWTVAVELPLAALCAPRGLRARAAMDSVWINLTTHPAAWLAYQRGLAGWAALEGAVLVLEIVLYLGVTRLAPRRAILCGACANAASAALSYVF